MRGHLESANERSPEVTVVRLTERITWTHQLPRLRQQRGPVKSGASFHQFVHILVDLSATKCINSFEFRS